MLHKPDKTPDPIGDKMNKKGGPSRLRRFAVTIALGLVLIAGAAYFVMQPQSNTSQQRGARFRGADGPAPVLIAIARTADVPVYLDGVGTTRALNTVTVKPQVDGKLADILFKEGRDVERGEVIARIDPTTYQAQYDQAVAKKAQDEAQLANARLDLDRYIRLSSANAINRQQVDTQRALVAQLEAQVRQDQAAIDNARAVLNYTTITAPISGRTGMRLVDVGNIVRSSETTGLVVITQVKPISILFTLPQQELPRVNAAARGGPLPVEALGADNRSVIDRGTLQVVDNQVDQTTGTIRLKAEFPNAELQLWPGQFVNVRLLVQTLRNVVVTPTAAVQRGPNGTFVYVATEDNTAKVRSVTVAQQDETQAVISTGLQAGERIVTSGFSRLSEGASISVDTPGATEGASAPAVDQPPRRRREGGAATTREGEAPAGRRGGAPGPAR